jgi:hypothetical protein
MMAAGAILVFSCSLLAIGIHTRRMWALMKFVADGR